ncbi:MAG: TlpA disulfide reductase family protein [Planctomycetota bacterium]
MRKTTALALQLSLSLYAFQAIGDEHFGVRTFEDSATESLLGLESEELDTAYFERRSGPELNIRLSDATQEDFESIPVSCTLVTLNGQVPLEMESDGKGVWRITIQHPLPYQQIWLAVGELYYGQLVLNEGLRVDVNVAQLKNEPVQFWGTGIEFAGADGALTEQFNRRTAHRRTERLAIDRKKQAQALFNHSASIDERISSLKKLQSQLDEINQDFARSNPSTFQAVLSNDVRSLHYSEIILCHALARKPMSSELMKEVLLHEPALVSNDSLGYYRHLGMLITSLSESENLTVLEESITPSLEDPSEFDAYLLARRQMLRNEPYDAKIIINGKKFLRMEGSEQKKRREQLRFAKLNSIEGRKGDLVKLTSTPDDVWARDNYLTKLLPTLRSRWCRAYWVAQIEADRSLRETVTLKLSKTLPEEKKADLGRSLGRTSDGSQLFVSDHESPEELVASIRASFPGSALVLDIWGPWCAPCIKDLKTSDEVKAKLKELSVEIVYLCVESEEETWSRKVAELSIPGTHIFLDQERSIALAKFFLVKGYPTYVFINRNGEYERDLIGRLPDADIEQIRDRLNAAQKSSSRIDG